MLDYKLYYWDLPFRGNFIQLFLEEVEAGYQHCDAGDIYPQKSLKIKNPGMASPYLYECKSKTYFAQMPACLMHLGREYDYLPKRSETHTLALKTILDCNDVLVEITNYNGSTMWTKNEWELFRYSRLSDWMKIFEKTGRDHGLKGGSGNGSGFLLGSRLSVADIATAALFGTMVYSFPALEEDLREHAPRVAGLCWRVESRPNIKPFLQAQREENGRGYCGGQIEESLREIVGR
ncbi:glutathione S-transferase family protein [Microbulbifer halophilus]|uniref:Glutathione S-transferase family protein n=1 Tax=Microbulbifer halophilus TaxID=453963 RepID=A0ABW5E896_9GAMM|nr:glutathione S-transferase family protein [Microbulbifer halophilus]MCW8126716.1 glutathione S-transferase family protein [Microbulbifer halophilus]